MRRASNPPPARPERTRPGPIRAAARAGAAAARAPAARPELDLEAAARAATRRPPEPPPAPSSKPPASTPELVGAERVGRTGMPRGREEEVADRLRAPLPTPDERAERRMLIFQLLNAGADPSQIRTACRDRFGMRNELVDDWIKRIKSERAKQFDADRPRYKSEQVARLQADLVRMRSAERKNWSAIARHEGLLARIVGTLEPVNVGVSGTITVREALVAVVANLDAESFDDLVQEELALVAAAEQARILPTRPSSTTELVASSRPSSRPLS